MSYWGNFDFQFNPIEGARKKIQEGLGKPQVMRTVMVKHDGLETPEDNFSVSEFADRMRGMSESESYQYWIDVCEKYGHNKSSTKYIQVLVDDLPILKEIEESFPLQNIEARVIRFNPGESLPPHVDMYEGYLIEHDVKDVSTVVRYLTFLEDWEPGHSFFLEDECITWKKGDTYLLGQKGSEKFHGTGNYGYTPKWTLRFTGTMEDNA